MNEPTYLITGATGKTGGAAARILLERGARVRVLARKEDERSARLRDLGAEVALGDLLDFDAVRRATTGVSRVYFCYPIAPGLVQASAQLAQASKEAGVELIVNMSQRSARSDASSNAAQQHWLSERVFDSSSVPSAHIRPTYFAEWLLMVAPLIKEGRILAPFGTTGRHAPIAAEDQARVIVGMLRDPARHAGKTYPLFGPVELTQPEIATIVGRVLGKPVTYEQVSIERFGEILGKRATPFLLQHLKEVAIDHGNGIFAGTNDVVEKVGGEPPMTVEAFVTKHRAAFV